MSFVQELPLSHPQLPTLTPREERQRKWDERRAELPESLDAQELTESEKEKEEKSPPHPKKRKNKKPKVVKGKEYKIWQPKRTATIRKCSLCSENFSSQKELNDHIAVHHKYKFLCSDRKCGKTFWSAQSFKKHKLCVGEMTFLCQVCGAKFPFASDLSNHQALHSQEKNFVCSYPKCSRKYKTKPELNHHCNYRHKQKSSKATIDRCTICKKTFERTKYLKEQMKVHVEDLPFEYSVCGERFNGGLAVEFT